MTDWRIPNEHQLPDVFFDRDNGAFDKGHLVRRDDVCWGRTFKDIQKSNGDTYHTTNCSPQVAGFNRSASGTDNWGDLENLVQKETKLGKGDICRSGAGRRRQTVPWARQPRYRTGADSDPVLEGRRREVSRWAAGVRVCPATGRFGSPAGVRGATNWKIYTRKIEDIEASLFGLAQLPWLRAHDAFGAEEAVRMSTQLA